MVLPMLHDRFVSNIICPIASKNAAATAASGTPVAMVTYHGNDIHDACEQTALAR